LNARIETGAVPRARGSKEKKKQEDNKRQTGSSPLYPPTVCSLVLPFLPLFPPPNRGGRPAGARASEGRFKRRKEAWWTSSSRSSRSGQRGGGGLWRRRRAALGGGNRRRRRAEAEEEQEREQQQHQQQH
jgi:hypothetical protein